jgi:hypothetical protein
MQLKWVCLLALAERQKKKNSCLINCGVAEAALLIFWFSTWRDVTGFVWEKTIYSLCRS